MSPSPPSASSPEEVFPPRAPWQELPAWRRHPGEDAWHQLSTEARRALLEPLVRARDTDRASSLHAQVPEAATRELATAGFLVRLRTPTGAQFGLDVAALPFVDWLVDQRELDLLSETPALEDWLSALFPDPCEALRLAQSAAAHGSLPPSIPDPHAFLATHARSPAWPGWALPRRGHAERLLLELVEKSGGRVPVGALTRLGPRVAPDELDRARERLVSRLVLFHALDPGTLELELGLLSPVRAGLGRAPGPAGPEPEQRLEPLATAPASSFERAVFQSDLGALLLELARSPAQIKTSNQLYEKTRVRLEGALEPLPSWLEAVGYLSRTRRLESALSTAQLRKLTKTRDKLLSLAERGREHLARPRAERLATFPEALPWQPGRHDEHFYGVPATSILCPFSLGERGGVRGRPQSATPSEQDKLALREAVARTFAELPVGRFHDLDAFARAACSGGKAPLLRGSEPERVLATLGLRLIPPDRHELEEASRQLLRHMIAGPLVHVGGVALAPLDAQDDPRSRDPRRRAYAFALTPVGRVFLGLDRALAPEAVPVAGDVIVQPSFEVVLFGSEPAALLELCPFAEPASGGAGDAARTLQLTRASVRAAIGAGLTADSILATLARLSRTGVPENVARTIRDWAGTVRLASLAGDPVLSLPDAETLERARQALGENARPLAHALAVPGIKPADLRRRLERLGIVLEL